MLPIIWLVPLGATFATQIAVTASTWEIDSIRSPRQISVWMALKSQPSIAGSVRATFSGATAMGAVGMQTRRLAMIIASD